MNAKSQPKEPSEFKRITYSETKSVQVETKLVDFYKKRLEQQGYIIQSVEDIDV